MAKLRKQFVRGTRYKVKASGLTANITYWGKFRGPKAQRKFPTEAFLIFRLEPNRFPRT
jgi:hypothetical protein